MLAHIKIQHLASVKEIKIDTHATVEDLQSAIEKAFKIPINEQMLFFNNRNLNLKYKTLENLNIKEGNVLILKKITKIKSKKSSSVNDLMKNPLVKNMLKNPQTLKNIKNMFPEIEEENSTLKMLINNGSLEDEIEKMTQDGDYLNSQLRNADVAMARLENMPGGMNMMSSLLKDVEDPMKSLFRNRKDYKSGKKIKEDKIKSIPGEIKENPFILYRKEIRELVQLGFKDVEENMEVLSTSNGDLNGALESLVERHGIE